MIVTKLQGGLGNQMFQYAVAVGAADGQNIYLDLSFLQKYNQSNRSFTARDFELNIFKLDAKVLSEKKKQFLFGKSTKERILKKILNLEMFIVKQLENEPIEIPQIKNLYLDGYFQSEKYFKNKREFILRSFKFPKLDPENNEILNKISVAQNSVSVHIRRGDYLKPENIKIHGLLSDEYYDSAISHILNIHPDAIFFIFSDDENFASMKYGGLPNFTIISNNHDSGWKDMALMSHCKHNIIANSSFSWWGAWLNTNEHKIVVAPKKWFNTDRYNSKDLIPESWQKI